MTPDQIAEAQRVFKCGKLRAIDTRVYSDLILNLVEVEAT